MHSGSFFFFTNVSILCIRIDIKVYTVEMDLLFFPPFSHYLLLFFFFFFSLHPCSVLLQLSIDVLHTAAKPSFSVQQEQRPGKAI